LLNKAETFQEAAMVLSDMVFIQLHHINEQLRPSEYEKWFGRLDHWAKSIKLFSKTANEQRPQPSLLITDSAQKLARQVLPVIDPIEQLTHQVDAFHISMPQGRNFMEL
jgi:hypothetical protein